MTIELCSQKKFLQEILYGVDGLFVDLTAVSPAFALTGDKPCVLQLLEVMRDRGPRQLHTITNCRKGLFNDPCRGATRTPLPYLNFRTRLRACGLAALLMDHEEDLEPLLIRQRLEYL